MMVPGRSVIDSSMVAGMTAEDDSRKPPGSSCARRRASTRCRSSASGPHSWSRSAALSGAGSSTAARNTACTRFGSLGMAGPSMVVHPTMRRSRNELSKKVEKSSGTESIAQPGPSVRPFLSGLVHREAQGGGGLLVAQTGEVPQLDDLGGYGVVSTEARQRVIEGEEILVGRGRRLVRQLDASPSATMSDALLAARV